MNREKVIIKLPYSEELLDELFGEFRWDRRQCADPHPERTGNCNGHPKPRGRDDRDSGEYQNAVFYCRHCYPVGNPARMTWDKETITLEACSRSSKPIRALIVSRRLNDCRDYPILGLNGDELQDLALVESY